MAEDKKYYVLIRERKDGVLGNSVSKTVDAKYVKSLYDLLESIPSTREERYNRLEL